jgi:hypothetical protein
MRNTEFLGTESTSLISDKVRPSGDVASNSKMSKPRSIAGADPALPFSALFFLFEALLRSDETIFLEV